MIKSYELMVGNYLKRNGVLVQIDARSMFDIWDQSKEYEAIPLSEKWLLDFGFEDTKTDGQMIYFKESVKQWQLYTNRVGFSIISKGIDQYKHPVIANFVKNVHELQNLWYCLTKELYR